MRSDVEHGSWIDPDAGKVTFAEYSSRWLAERPHLRPRTRELYEGELRLHILPALGATELREITPSRIRTWRAGMISAGKPGASTIAKCYRLVHAVFATAVEDGIVMRNPCVVKGASTERPAERPVATIGQVFELADAIASELRAAVLLATFCGLRLGEIRAADVADPAGRVVLRVVDDDAWCLLPKTALAPPAAVALDLLESGAPRHWIAAEHLAGDHG